MRILFVCSENRLRSPTAAAVFSEYDGVEAISAGTNKDCETPVSGDLIEWADTVLVMENAHRRKVARKFQSLLRDKKLAVLNIPDDFEFMDPILVRILRNRVPRYVRGLSR
ncbi:MAG: phosphotyrosine protein phosphatase [Pseudomonadota bacterium]